MADDTVSIQTIRDKYPQYKDKSDTELADAIYNKFYANKGITKDQVYSRLGLSSKPGVPTPQPEPVGTFEGLAEGTIHGLTKFGIGALEGVLQGGEWVRNKTGLPSNKKGIEELNRAKMFEEELHKRRMRGQGETGASRVGGFVGETAIPLLLPGPGKKVEALTGTAKAAARIAHSAVTGGVIGAAQPTEEGESKTHNAIVGALTGGVVQGGMEGVKKIAPSIGTLFHQVIGRTTGAGEFASREAVKGGEAFKKTIRGKESGSAVVQDFQDAVTALKNKRADAYRSRLAELTKNKTNIDLKPIAATTMKLFKRYNIDGGFDANGNLVIDTSRIAMGEAGRKDIQRLVQRTLNKWGSKPGDHTALGLDTLKRQLDDFYSDSSQARHFVATLRKSVHDTIAKEVPEYATMTKGYAEASSLIEDIESGLMLRSQGIQGHIVADQTLRRLTSALKGHFALRKELVDMLGQEAGQDLLGRTAGYAMRSAVPLGFEAYSGLGASAVLAHMINPAMYPLMLASSPRVVGEFLMAYGRASRGLSKIAPRAAKEILKNSIPRIAAFGATRPRGEEFGETTEEGGGGGPSGSVIRYDSKGNPLE